ncbi:hypothetical protein [Streptomyces sp. NPDC054863]
MRIIPKAAGAVAAAAALTLSGFLAAPAQAQVVQTQALQTSGYCDGFSRYYSASGSGYQPGQAIVVSFGSSADRPDVNLVVKADGTWFSGHDGYIGDFYISVHDTQGNVLAKGVWSGSCSIWG